MNDYTPILILSLLLGLIIGFGFYFQYSYIKQKEKPLEFIVSVKINEEEKKLNISAIQKGGAFQVRTEEGITVTINFIDNKNR